MLTDWSYHLSLHIELSNRKSVQTYFFLYSCCLHDCCPCGLIDMDEIDMYDIVREDEVDIEMADIDEECSLVSLLWDYASYGQPLQEFLF